MASESCFCALNLDTMTIDHLMLKVKDWPKAKAYYEAAFKPLGYEVLVDGGSWGGFTRPGESKGRIYVKQGTATFNTTSASQK